MNGVRKAPRLTTNATARRSEAESGGRLGAGEAGSMSGYTNAVFRGENLDAWAVPRQAKRGAGPSRIRAGQRCAKALQYLAQAGCARSHGFRTGAVPYLFPGTC
jgi:hypothetical protein